MSYRKNADVTRPYGKIIRLDKSLERNYSEIFRQNSVSGCRVTALFHLVVKNTLKSCRSTYRLTRLENVGRKIVGLEPC